MKKTFFTVLLVFSSIFAFSATMHSPEPAPTWPPDESIPCEMESVATDDYGQVYWHRIIFYDCSTGVQHSFFDVLSHQYFIYCMDIEPAWGCD